MALAGGRAGANLRAGPAIGVADPRFDAPGPVALRKSYIVASTQRAGAEFLCAKLWRTGVLGAPADYLAYPHGRVARAMATRLAAASPGDYLAKLLACRTSRNGVFGAEAYFNDFATALGRLPELLNRLAPITYIYLERRDQLAQAVAVAKAMQAERASAKGAPAYDRDLVSRALGILERGRLSWTRWFEAHGIEPFVVVFEDLVAGEEEVVRSVVQRLGVADDPSTALHPPTPPQPSIVGNDPWALRFKREIRRGVLLVEPDPAAEPAAEPAEPPPPTEATRSARPADEHIFDAFDALVESEAGAPRRRSQAARRLRRRYDAIVTHNRGLFQHARVLVLQSGTGRWALAALAAGAAHVTGLEPRRRSAELARKVFAEYGAAPGSYEFVDGATIYAALPRLRPRTVSLVLCTNFSTFADPHFFFSEMLRLRPRQIILDSDVAQSDQPVALFEALPGPADAGLVAVPSPALIRLLSESFGFRCRAIDWHGLGIADWRGVHDYERGRRATYLLEPEE
ncbi:MAG TPA: Stf0 family sulfotransferase [Stellaceae bacterium]|nr:Stf0 family sulfotransferase [Stellaceae bacterium]